MQSGQLDFLQNFALEKTKTAENSGVDAEQLNQPQNNTNDDIEFGFDCKAKVDTGILKEELANQDVILRLKKIRVHITYYTEKVQRIYVDACTLFFQIFPDSF